MSKEIKESRRPWWRTHFSNVLNIVGVILGVAGLFSGFWFYHLSIKQAAVSFLVEDPQLQIIDYSTLTDSSLRILGKDGLPIRTDVYIAKVHLWNSGNLAVKSENILDPIRISTAFAYSERLKEAGLDGGFAFLTNDPQIAVLLEAKELGVTRRSATGIKSMLASPSEVAINFKILEPGDGISLQLVYSANSPHAFGVLGAIEGVEKIGSPNEGTPSAIMQRVLVEVFGSTLNMVAILACGLFVGALIPLLWSSTKVQLNGRKLLKTSIVFAVILAFAFAVGILAEFQAFRESARKDVDSLIPKSLSSTWRSSQWEAPPRRRISSGFEE